MSFADHIARCNNYDPARVVPLVAGDTRIGWIRHDNARVLTRFPSVFGVAAGRVELRAAGDADTVSAAVDEVVEALVADGLVPKVRNETFDVMARWGDTPILRVDRGAVSFFGVRAYGVHLNGYRDDGGRLSLWIGQRAPDKRVDPNKLDNLVAGGIGNGLAALATLVKEADEEAAIPPALIARAIPVGAMSYRMETPLGIRDDVMFVYDLAVPADFTPRNRDGEIVRFELMPVETVLARIRTTDDFKFNVNLVILDFALRHGLLKPDEPGYLDVANGLHRPLD
jgi:8-oxo-dGTP pyrophosphatase MutT (NUDIX family)